MKLYCMWCGHPVKTTKSNMRRKIRCFRKPKLHPNSHFGIFCGASCRQDFKDWLQPSSKKDKPEWEQFKFATKGRKRRSKRR